MALEKAIWNEDPQICNSSKLYENTYKKKDFQFGIKDPLFGYF